MLRYVRLYCICYIPNSTINLEGFPPWARVTLLHVSVVVALVAGVDGKFLLVGYLVESAMVGYCHDVFFYRLCPASWIFLFTSKKAEKDSPVLECGVLKVEELHTALQIIPYL